MASLGSCAIYYKDKRTIQAMFIPWVVSCLFLMLYTAVLRRTSQPDYSIHLMPFWSIQSIKDEYIETLYEKIYNVIFFVPYGVLNGLGFRVYGLWSSVKRTVLIGFLTSVTIELLQLITRTGTCETDDVICNTLGCGIGAVMGVLTMTMRYRYDDDDGTSYDDDNDDFGS